MPERSIVGQAVENLHARETAFMLQMIPGLAPSLRLWLAG